MNLKIAFIKISRVGDNMTQINMYSSKEEIDTMTNEQAAEIISKFCSSGNDYDFSPRPHMAKANQLAVKALSEIDNLKEIISDLERERQNNFASGYNNGFKAGTRKGFEDGYLDGYSTCFDTYNESGF